MVTTPSWRVPAASDLLCDEATAIFSRGNGARAFWWMRRCIGDGSVCVKEFSVLGLRRCGSGTSSCVLHIGGRFLQFLIYVLGYVLGSRGEAFVSSYQDVCFGVLCS